MLSYLGLLDLPDVYNILMRQAACCFEGSLQGLWNGLPQNLVLRRAMSILSPVQWLCDVRNDIEDREHVLDVAFDPFSPDFDVLSNNSNLRTMLDGTQIVNMESWALRRSVSPLGTAQSIVKAMPFSSQSTPSRLAWENHRARILQFYMNEDKTLREVMQIMQDEHGFQATMKMYKNRLKSWNARKYMTKTERDVASRVMQARERRGEPYGRVIVRGKDRKLDVLLRHMCRSRACARRRKALEDGDPSQDIIIDDLTFLQHQVFLSPLIYPAGLEKTVEVLCKEIPHLVLNKPEEGLSYELFYALKQACICSDNNFHAEVRTSLNLAAEWFHANIAARPALTLMSLLRSQTITAYDGFYRTELFRWFYKHLFDLTEKHHGSQHSLTKLVLHVLQMPNEPRAMQLAFQNVVTQTIVVLQKHNPSETYRWQGCLAVKLHEAGETARAGALLLEAVSSFGKDDVYKDNNKWLCTLNLARHYIADESDMDEEAEYMLRNLLEAGTNAMTRKVNPWHANHVYRGLGQLAEKRGDLEAAVDFYRLRIQGAAETWGENGVLTLHALENLARLLRDLKRDEEAVVLEKRMRLKDEFGEVGLD